MSENRKAGFVTQPTTLIDSNTTPAVKQGKAFFIGPNGEAMEKLFVSTADGSLISVSAEEVLRRSLESVIRDLEPDVKIRHDYFVYQSYYSPETGWRWGRTRKQADELAKRLTAAYEYGSVKEGGSGSAHWLTVRFDGLLNETVFTIYFTPTPEEASNNG